MGPAAHVFADYPATNLAAISARTNFPAPRPSRRNLEVTPPLAPQSRAPSRLICGHLWIALEPSACGALEPG